MNNSNSAGPYRWISPLRNARGVTLVELIILLVVASIAIPGLMVMFIEGVRNSANAQLNTVAAGLAQELMEEIKMKRWDENSPIPPGTASVNTTFGLLDGETRCDPVACSPNYFDDIDDYDGLDNSPPQNPHGAPLAAYASHRRTVDVCYVADVAPAFPVGGNNVADGVCIAGPTNSKLITVTVESGGNMLAQLKSVATNYVVSD